MGAERSISSVLSALKWCMNTRDLSRAKKLHAEIVEIGLDSDLFVASTLVTVYSKCGSLVDACNVFFDMKFRDVVAWNNIILAHEENGEAAAALELFDRMESLGFAPAARTFVAALKACASIADAEDGIRSGDKVVKMNALDKGLLLHSQASARGFVEDTYVSNTLVDVYSKCGSMIDARRTFDSMKCRDVVSWTALILGYADNGCPDLALQIFEGMKHRDCRPNALTFVAALKACVGLAIQEEESKKADGKNASFREGLRVHAQLLTYGFDAEILVVNTLMDMYFKCGRLPEARSVFESIPSPSVVSWTVLTLGYAENGDPVRALEGFATMADECCLPNSRTFIAALKACGLLARNEVSKEVDGEIVKLESLNRARSLHSKASKQGWDSDVFLSNTLIDVYAGCGSMAQALEVFETMRRRSIVSWNILMLGYCENGQAEQALSLFARMDILPDSLSFVAACKACGSSAVKEDGRKVDGKIVKVSALQKGLELHSRAVDAGYASDILVANTLLDMYMKCGSVMDALKVFEGMSTRTLVSWAVLILGYAENNEGELALEFYQRLRLRNEFVLDALTFVAALRGCTSIAVKESGELLDGKIIKQQGLKIGTEIYSQASEQGFEMDLLVTSTLLDLYTKCGSMANAREIFDKMPVHSSACWNALLLGYAESGDEDVVLQLFEELKLRGVIPEARTFVAVLKSCTNLAGKEQGTLLNGRVVKIRSLEKGFVLHAQAARTEMDMFVYSTLIDMYSKCGSMVDAAKVFLGMEYHDVVSYTSLMTGYADNGDSATALGLLACMDQHSCAPNAFTFLAALKACGSIAAIQTAVGLHGRICRLGLESSSAILETCLLDVYAKSGSMNRAQRAFDSSTWTKNNTVPWNALITGYSHHGDTDRVFYWFNRMRDEGHRGDAVTWTSVLSACSHAGLVDEGEKYFREMVSVPGMDPGIEHYHCMVDLLSRYNRLEAAVAMVEAMPWDANEVTWTTVLGACWKWKNVEVGKRAFEGLQRLKGGPAEGAGFVLLSNIYETVK